MVSSRRAILAGGVLLVLFLPLAASAATSQVITSRSGGSSGPPTGTKYVSVSAFQNTSGDDTFTSIYSIMPIAGSFSTLRVVSDYVPGGSDTVVITLRKNAANTALTCTITSAATTCSDLTHSVSVAQGDKLVYQVVWSATSGAGQVTMAVDFTPTTANDTLVTTGTGTVSASAENYVAISPFSTNVDTTATGMRAVIPEAGTIDQFVASSTAPGAGKTWDFTLMQNTSTTTITCQINGNAANRCTDNTHSVSVSAGDLLNIATVPTGTPSNTSVGAGFRFVPATAGDFIFVAPHDNGSDSTSVTTYRPISGLSPSSTAEASTTQVVNNMTVTGISVKVTVAPGTGKSRVFTLRKNNQDTALACTVSNAATTCTATGSISVADGDLLDTSNAPTGTPASSQASVSLIANRPVSSAPTVTTQSASSVTNAAATLNGTITDLGGANVTTSGFAYGTASDLATVIATTSASGAFSSVPSAFTASVSSLTCGTTYYFRPYAINSAGTGLGTIVSFATSACAAPTITTQSASSVSFTSATLNGTITDLGGANVTTSGFAYGTASDLATVIATTSASGAFSSVPSAFTASVSSLTCGTTYYFRPYAINSAGTGLGTIVSFATLSCGLAPYFLPTRTSGVAPLAVFFDSASTTSSYTTDYNITSNPFHDLDYAWDFGDPTAGTWTYGTASSSKNLAYGPEAAHVFETAGTYTVTMTVRDGTDTAATTTTITVTDPDTVFSGTNTVCVAADTTPVAGSDGCPAGASVAQQSDFVTILSAYALSGKRVLLKHDDTFTVSTSAVLNATGPGIIGKYGTGVNPIILATGTDSSRYLLQLGSQTTPNSTSDLKDWRIMDLEFNGGGTFTQVQGPTGRGGINQVTLLRIYSHHLHNGFSFDTSILDYWNNNGNPGHTLYDQIAIIDSRTDNITGVSAALSIYGSASRFSIMGNNLDNDLGGEHTVRLPYVNKGVISHNTMQGEPINKHALTIRAAIHGSTGVEGLAGTDGDTKHVVVSDNRFIATNSTWTTYYGSQASANDERVTNIITERNWYTATNITTTQTAIQFYANNQTIRNNIFNLTGAKAHGGISIGSPASYPATTWSNLVNVYNNTFYSADTDNDFYAVNVDTNATNVTVKSNLGRAPNDTQHGGVLCNGSNTLTTCTTNGLVISYNSTTAQVLSTNPSFASTTPSYSLTDDFKLNVGSYAIGTTTSQILGVLRDFSNTLRPSTPSIGAFDLNAPSLTTADASPITSTAATLNGSISITGGAAPSTRGFAYGTDSALSSAATTTESGSFTTGSFSSSLASLICNTAYYARPYAANSVGTSVSTTTSFTTSACTGGGGARDASLALSLSIVNDDGGSLSPSDLALFINDTPVSPDVPTSFPAPAPAYAVIAPSPSGYSRFFSGSCDADGRIALSPGDAKTCLLSYNDLPQHSSSASSPSPSAPTTPSESSTRETDPAIPAPPAPSSSLSASQISSILSLLASFSADPSVIESVRMALAGTPDNPRSGLSGSQSVLPASSTFTRDLSLYDTGPEVKALQIFLNTRGFLLASTGPGSPGKETATFGMATYRALVRFQRANNLPQSGFFGPKTRGVAGRE